MGPERLELSHIAAPDPKSGASTNFATGPLNLFNCKYILYLLGLIVNVLTICAATTSLKRYLIIFRHCATSLLNSNIVNVTVFVK